MYAYSSTNRATSGFCLRNRLHRLVLRCALLGLFASGPGLLTEVAAQDSDTKPPVSQSETQQAPASATGTEASPPTPATEAEDYSSRISKLASPAIAYLLSKQAEDGSYKSPADPAVTALVATALMRHGKSPDDPAVAKAIQYVKSFVKEDGGIYREGSYYRNYETSVAILCLAEANAGGHYDAIIAEATTFIKDIQWAVEETAPGDRLADGGSGYGKHGRPDLSNTQFFLDALHASGGTGDHVESIQRALAFVSRCQNLESEHNTTKFAKRVPKDGDEEGGFYYTPAAGGSSQAGNTPEGGLRSYGSMTYAGLKSMIYAGVNKEDQRVIAARKWIQRHYSLTDNPGMGAAGLFYYYHTFAKALHALDENQLVDAEGVSHDWRKELLDTFQAKQRPDGSWINAQDRWYEGDPVLVTCYVLLGMSHCQP